MEEAFIHYNPVPPKSRRKIQGILVFAGYCPGTLIMKLKILIPTALLALVLPGSFTLAAENHAGHGANQKKAATAADTELIAKARASYPLKTCLVSDEPLGGMGEPVAYVHHAEGKPDRVVFFCCAGCIDDFKAEPAKFLKKVDEAAKAKPAAATKTDRKTAHQH